MKQLFFISCVALLTACNNGTATQTTKDSVSTSTAGMAEKKNLPEMPYTLEKPYQNWQTGDPNHALTVMTALKAFESGDIAKCMNGFADTVKLYMDNMEGTFSRDSLAKMFTAERGSMANMKVTMTDWESVISSDKKEEWVTLWYKEAWTDKKGKTDSISYTDDFFMKNGKIAVLSEAVRHYPAKK